VKIKTNILLQLFLLLFVSMAYAQENVVPLNFNGEQIKNKGKHTTSRNKTTSLSLPFFEDFTSYSGYPDNTVWVDREIYTNNTMCVSPVSRGVATFDGLNADGIPYEPNISIGLVYADSLTSLPINLSGNNPGDSIYFSFFYQPQGNGFYPENQDSLMLYFKKSNGAWVKVWSKEGTTLDSFRQVMIPVADTVYMFDTFQFRFVNKASLNTNDDVWNVDYIRMAANRNMNDTVISDVAFTLNPSFILNDFTYMPYRQFIADPNKERATLLTGAIRNNYPTGQTVNYSYTAREISTNTPLFTSSGFSSSIGSGTYTPISFPNYTNTIPSPNLYDNFTFENKYIIQSLGATDKTNNDTIIRYQRFHNYLAYDDGTAEKSYYLHLFPTLPGKIAIEFHLNKPDTIKGVSIYFGRQVPLAYAKYFSVAVYKSISMGAGSDVKVYQEDLLIPAYQRNDYEWTYKFSNPVPMDAGTFYIGTIQPALSNSDSLYIGLDVNRVAANHLYYNVVGYWESSTVSGALMIRPILGQIIASGINDRLTKEVNVSIAPNPSSDKVQVRFEDNIEVAYSLCDMQGRIVVSGKILNEDWIDIHSLAGGVYFLKLNNTDRIYQTQKIIKY
jgi:hypothetical protein